MNVYNLFCIQELIHDNGISLLLLCPAAIALFVSFLISLFVICVFGAVSYYLCFLSLRASSTFSICSRYIYRALEVVCVSEQIYS